MRSGSSSASRRLRALSRLPSKNEVMWFQRRLRPWFKSNRRDFPWRNSDDPYVICISEIFLQQTSALKVADLIGMFTDRYPDWNTVAKSAPAEIEAVIYPLGIHKRRARTVHSLANVIINLDGLPRTRHGLENLPGFLCLLIAGN